MVRGEPVRSRLEIYPNELIFKKDEVILTKTYKLDSENQPEIILQDFLSEVNRIAVEKGILTDPLTGSVGIMDGTQLYEIFDSISTAKGRILLRATAREKTDSLGPLRLNIKLEQK